MSEHTPGPWEVGYGARASINVTSREVWICGELDNNRDSMPGEEAKANARLIAAAPDLLSALREAISQIEYLHEKFRPTGSGNATLAKLSAAIAKATQP